MAQGLASVKTEDVCRIAPLEQGEPDARNRRLMTIIRARDSSYNSSFAHVMRQTLPWPRHDVKRSIQNGIKWLHINIVLLSPQRSLRSLLPY